ncbi:uncharacterized protein MYCGRDRAFT_51621, partial [Zymoseptoria tritici IPO323]
GDEALAGTAEINITHRFAPDNTKSRTVYFKGVFLSIYHEERDEYKTHKDHVSPTVTYEPYEVPAGYTVYVRGACVYFQI